MSRAHRQRRRHRRADAGPAEHVELGAGFAERLVDGEMRRAERSAAAGDEPDCAAGEKTRQPLDVGVVFERDMVVHENVALREPRGGSRSVHRPLSWSMTSRRVALG